MSTEQAFCPPGPGDDRGRLRDLIGTINREHTLAYQRAVEALEHAIRCGEALIEAREIVPEGEWLEWCETNLNLGTGTLHRYIRVATYKQELFAAERKPASINAAISYLRAIEAPAASSSRNGRRPTFDVDEARRLRKQGMTYTNIGALLGVSDVAVWRQLTPGATKRTLVYATRYKRKRAAERRALEQAERDKAVAKVGGAAAEAYALLRRTALALDQAMREATANELHALRDALAHTHRAEDAIVSALRLERGR